MEAIVVPVAIYAFIGAIGGILVWSIVRGLRLLRRTYAFMDSGRHRQARRLLAWNLIEPGITVPNLLVVWMVDHEWMWAAVNWLGLSMAGRIRGNPYHPLAPIVCFWPMLLILVVIPWLTQRTTDPTLRQTARDATTLGLARFIVTVLTFATNGLGMLVGVPLLLWSLKRVRRWSEALQRGAASSAAAAAISGGPHGMRVLGRDHDGPPSDVNVLIADHTSPELPR